MKNILKNIFVLTLGLFILQGCDSGDGNGFGDDPTTGWIEFRSSATTTGQTQSLLEIPLDIQVPQYPNGLTVDYTITAVDGDFTQFLSQSSGSQFIDPAVTTRAVPIQLMLNNMDVGRDFVTSFDVTITAVSDGIGVGVDGSSITSHRVTIPCSNPDVLPDTYFVGDYTIADVSAVIGPGNGTENIGSGTVTLTVDPANPNRRLFQASILPAFTGGALRDFSIEFSTENVVTLGGFSGSGISCSGPEYGFTGAAIADSVPWDICNDQAIVIEYTEDPLSGCGGPYSASFSLTKI